MYTIIFNPKEAIAEIAWRRPWGIFFFVYSLALVSFLFSKLISFSIAVYPSPVFLIVLLPAGFIVGLIGIGISVAIFHLAAEFFGGKGNMQTLFVALGILLLPMILLLPLSVSSAVFGFIWAFGLLKTGVILWVMSLHILSIREIYRLSTGKAVIAYIFPGLIFVAIPFLFIALMLYGVSFFALPLSIT